MNIQKQMRDTTSKWKGFDKVCKNLVSLFVFHLALVTSAFGKMWSELTRGEKQKHENITKEWASKGGDV